MLRKYKNFLIGFLVGALLFSFVPVSASVKEFILTTSSVKITVDGKEFTDKELPVLIMQPGYNYIPAATFREICDKIGVGFEWVGDKNEIQIKTKGEGEKGDNNMGNTAKDEYNLLIVDGVEYIALKEISDVHEDYYFLYHDDTGLIDFMYKPEQKTILEGINFDYKAIGGNTSIKYDVFKKDILPLIK